MAKKFNNKMVKGAALAMIIATIFGGMTSCKLADRVSSNNSNKEDTSDVNYVDTVNLPASEKASTDLENLLGEYYGSYMLKGETLVRMPCPANGDSIKVNITTSMTQEQLEVIKYSFDEYNKIFEVINPNYKFELNYNPTQQDLKNPYNIDIKVVDEFAENEKGIAHASGEIMNQSGTVDGYETYNNVITIRRDCLNQSEALMGALKHEVGHLFGRGDAYNNEDVKEQTIMSGGSLINGNLIVTPYSSLKNTDVAILDALYRQPDNVLSDDYINNFVENYESCNTFSYEHFTAREDFEQYKQEIMNMDLDVLIESIKNSYYADDFKQEIIELLENNPTINGHFGEKDLKFAECPNDTGKGVYFSSKNNNLTWESRSSWGTREIIKQNGIVRKGSEYDGTIMINVGDYVLSFEYEKDFSTGKIEVSDEMSSLYKNTEMNYLQYLDYLNNFESESTNEQ